MREEQKAKGLPMRYDGRWRDRAPGPEQDGKPFVVRLKARQEGETIVHDKVLGDVRFENSQLDDMVLLRSDGNPTYMLAVVVDDADMGVTHVIRGADHLNNAARQLQIIEQMGWTVPVYGHLPLINGPDGAKLSKRHGRSGGRGLSRHGLSARDHAQLSAAAGLEPWRRRDHLHRAGDRLVQPGVDRQIGSADGITRSWTISTATTSARRGMRRWWRKSPPSWNARSRRASCRRPRVPG